MEQRPRTRLALLLVLPLASSQHTISERTLRLPAEATITLTAQPGCFEWSSERSDIAEIAGEPVCDGSSSTVTIRTKAPLPGGASCAFVTARAVDAANAEAAAADLFCEINVATVASVRIETTVRSMVAHELQWLQLTASDADGNAFSPLGLSALDVAWRFSPPGLVNPLAPSETMQQLDASLAELEAVGARAADGTAKWLRYHRLAVLAGGTPAAAVKVTAEVLPAAAAEPRAASRRPVADTSILSVEPSSLELAPKGRAVLSPLMTLLYKLRTCGDGGRCSAPPPGKVGPAWRVEPPPVAGVLGGLVTARAAGAYVATLIPTTTLISADVPSYRERASPVSKITLRDWLIAFGID